MADPDEIARRLTKAQKREINSQAPWFMAGLKSQNARHKIWLGMHQLEIASCTLGWWSLTHLGTQVRAIVEQGGGDG